MYIARRRDPDPQIEMQGKINFRTFRRWRLTSHFLGTSAIAFLAVARNEQDSLVNVYSDERSDLLESSNQEHRFPSLEAAVRPFFVKFRYGHLHFLGFFLLIRLSWC
jgi:hypothetical protein